MALLSPNTRSLTVTTQPRDGVPHALRDIVGGMLELMIHSVEGVRDLFGKLSQR